MWLAVCACSTNPLHVFTKSNDGQTISHVVSMITNIR